ncbi:MAG: TIGR02466 family protein [Cyanobacteriota bacterium]|nr:TIGR02466 family protein [Cyanobacteriota bacterium]
MLKPTANMLTRRDAFPTPIWQRDVEDSESLNPILLKTILTAKSNDPVGIKISNVLGWHSAKTLHQQPTLKPLLEVIGQSVLAITQEQAWNLNKVRPALNACWAMVSQKYAYSSLHNHPNAILSGVYYVQTPENCGDLYFHDPRDGSQILMPPLLKQTAWTMGKLRTVPQAGRLILFPSWLWHAVEPNLSDELRISVSFNIGVA